MLQLFTRTTLLICFFYLSASTSIANELKSKKTATLEDNTRIIFLSCINQDYAQPLWHEVNTLKPDLLLMMGDNVYANSGDPEILKAEYARLNAQAVFADIRKNTPLMGTWDDHDFGENDGGASFQGKDAAQTAFLDFFAYNKNDPQRTQKGIYNSRTIGKPNQRIQIIMLDTRYFRGELNKNAAIRYYTQRYDPSTADKQVMLGEKQWHWLKEKLKEPAEVRIIVSSIQFLADNHGFERWGTLPKEKQRMLDLLQDTRAKGVIFLSGDRHLGELMRIEGRSSGLSYPLHDITSSSFNNSVPAYFKNDTNMRVGEAVYEDHFGSLELDWNKPDPSISIKLLGENHKVLLNYEINLSTLQ